MKTCTKCGETKPLDDFHRRKRSGDGRRPRCKDCIQSYNVAYHQANVDEVAERHRAYCATNPHIGWESKYRYRVRRYGFVPVVESFTRAEVVARYGDACFHCGGDFDELDHHPVPVIAGGPHTLDNCRPSCTPCNRSRNQAAA